jgi:SAM-dependent methyltransferase
LATTTELSARHPVDAAPASPPAAVTDLPAPAGAAADGLAEHLFTSAIATLEHVTVRLGLRLGLYTALNEHGPADARDLAERAGIDARYAREWLEQQAVAGFLHVEHHPAGPRDDLAPPDHHPDRRRFALAEGVADVLLRPDSPSYLGTLPLAVLSVTRVLDDLEHAYRTGTGVPFERYGDDLRHGLGALNGATFDRSLADWLAHLPDVDLRLRSAPTPVILDLGCGTGRSTLALARLYPRATVRGVDLDAASVAHAEATAARQGLADRVTFVTGDAASLVTGERYDLVTVFEALHDVGDPVGTLAAARRVLADGGAVLVADELTADTFDPDAGPLERFLYGWSTLHCLPATRAEDHVTANGTVLRATTMQAWARAAGFPAVTVLDIEDELWRFYRL